MTNFQEAFYATFHQNVPLGPRLRMAPTPSGYLHLGNGINFILNWLAARATNGQLLLRIDDLDADRKRPEYVQDIFDTLHWLGLTWQEGPGTPEEFEDVWSNRHRMKHYQAVLTNLAEANQVYACNKSRKDLQPWPGELPSEFRQQGISLEQPDTAWRAITPPGFPLPDFIVRRRDNIPAYQVASLADDLLMGITQVIRGADLASSTAAQQWLASSLSSHPSPALIYHKFLKINFLHHPLVVDTGGAKLSKSAGAMALKTLREQHTGPNMVFNQAAKMLGLTGDVSAAETLLSRYLDGSYTHLSCNFMAFSNTSRTQPAPPGSGDT